MRYLGNSNFAGWQIADADWTARSGGLTPFISAQNQYSLLERGVEAEVVPGLRALRAGLLPFFPLANGLLTGKYQRGETPPSGSRLAGGGRYAERLAAAPMGHHRGDREVRRRARASRCWRWRSADWPPSRR